MRRPLAVTSLAWPAGDFAAGLDVLDVAECDLELAPFGVFGRWDDLDREARALRRGLDARGIRCVALQGILFGAGDVSLFGDAGSRARLDAHLARTARLAGILGAGACVFGAPRQRDPGNLSAAEAWDTAAAALRRAGPAFASEGSRLAFEANARAYGCRFVTGTAEAARLVADVGEPGIGLQLDTGTAFLEGEDPADFAAAAPLAVHAHVSEPDLRAPGEHGLDHAALAGALRAGGYAGTMSVEMKAAGGGDWRAAVVRAAGFAWGVYRTPAEPGGGNPRLPARP